MKIHRSALFVFQFLLVSAAFAADPAKPNILWIVAEDLGADMGVQLEKSGCGLGTFPGGDCGADGAVFCGPFEEPLTKNP